MKTELAQ
jgi:hypothetical protein